MRTVTFIRGVIGICGNCTQELSLRTHVQRVAKYGEGYAYRSLCSCGALVDGVVSRETHFAGLEYLKQVIHDERAADIITEPLNPAEAELLDFQEFLEAASSDVIWQELYASS
jgi:hypothetical protein